jgi:CRISPR system Cascade subunit CasD
MSVLLLRLAAPMQSWGVMSRFDIRDTGYEPSKSGVIGLLCAALGRGRSENVEDLAALRMGVRVDEEGVLLVDYHTAGGSGIGVINAKGTGFSTVESKRYYLADANFLVALEGDLKILRTLHEALRLPRWPLFLGRKSFVPGLPVWISDGLREQSSIETVLASYRWMQVYSKRDPTTATLRVVVETDFTQMLGTSGEPVSDRIDQPYRRAFLERSYVSRRVRTYRVPIPSTDEVVG